MNKNILIEQFVIKIYRCLVRLTRKYFVGIHLCYHKMTFSMCKNEIRWMQCKKKFLLQMFNGESTKEKKRKL